MDSIKDRLLTWYRRFRQWQLTPAKVPPLKNQQVVCLNCDESYEGSYCPRCGQPAKTTRFNFNTTLRNALDVWGMGSRSMLRALIHLTLRPGYMIADYLRGHRQPYFPPFKTLFILTATAILMANVLPMEKPIERPVKEEIEESMNNNNLQDEIQKEFGKSMLRFTDALENMSKTEKPLYLLIIQSFFTIGMYCFFRNSPGMGQLTITEQFYGQVLIANQLQFFSIIYMLFTFEVSYDDFALPVDLIAIVGFIDNYQLYGFKWWKTLLRLAGVVGVSYIMIFMLYLGGSAFFYFIDRIPFLH